MGSENSEVRSVDANPGSGSGPINITTAQLNAGTETAIDAVAWTLVGGYNAVQNPYSYVGFAPFSLPSCAAHRDDHRTHGFASVCTRGQRLEDLWDAIIGVRSRVKLGDGNWFMPYYDVAAGDSG